MNRELSVRYGLSILTTALLAGHLLFGCCWHHAHAECQDAALSSSPLEHDDLERHDHEEHAPPADDCDHGRCIFVSATKVVSSPTTTLFAITRLQADQVVDEIDAIESPGDESGDTGPPIRIHLRYCLLLI